MRTGVIDQEEKYFPVIRQIAGGDVLLVSGEIGECNLLFVDDVKESGRPAAMLDIRLSIVVRRREEDARLPSDKIRALQRDGRFPSFVLLAACVSGARSMTGLHRLDGGREDHVAGIPSELIILPSVTFNLRFACNTADTCGISGIAPIPTRYAFGACTTGKSISVPATVLM